MQLQVEAACAGNPGLKKHIISDEEAAYNFKMSSEKNALYSEGQPDIEFELVNQQGPRIESGADDVRIDHGL